MEFWSFIHLLIVLGVITGVKSAVRPVTVKLNHSAVLPCSDKCSGVVRWTVFHRPRDPLAECDQTSCRSVKEGYQMIYNQYLQGNLSLIITDVDYSKRARYTCECDRKYLCDVNLRIEALNTTLQIQPGGSLLLDFDVSEPVEVIYNRTGEAGRPNGLICSVDGRSSECESEYTQRASVLSALELRDMALSDSGVYTVRDTKNKDAVHVYTVDVRDCPTCQCSAVGVPVWMVVGLLVVVLVVIVVGVVMIVKQKKEIQKLRNNQQNYDVQYKQNGSQNNIQVNIPEQEKLNR